MTSKQIYLTFKGLETNGGDLRFDDFIAELEAVRQALMQVGKLITGGQSVYYRVVDLKCEQPAAIVLEAVSLDNEQIAAKVVALFMAGLKQTQEGGEIAKEFDYDTLQAFKRIAAPLGEKRTRIHIRSNGSSVSISPQLIENVDRATGKEEIVLGSLSGHLGGINSHSEENTFPLYPIAGASEVACTFKPELKQAALEAFNRYVTVYGYLHYHQRAKFPHAAAVDQIEVHPKPEDAPSLLAAEGVHKKPLKDGKTSVELLRELRDEWD